MVRTKRSERIGRNPKAPRVQLYCGEAWFDVYDPPNKTLPADELNSLVILAQLAIYHYNVNQVYTNPASLTFYPYFEKKIS